MRRDRPRRGHAVLCAAAVAVGLTALTEVGRSVAQAANGGAASFTYVGAGGARRVTCDEGPAGWQSDAGADAAWATAMPDDAAPCAVMRVRHRLAVGPELGRLSVLELRVRYRDGFVAWLNGVEIARRNITGSSTVAGVHGGESERIFVAVRPGMLNAGENLLALESRPSRPTRSAWVDAQLTAAEGLRVVRGPYLQNVVAGYAEVMLSTDLPSVARVTFEASGGARAGRVSAPVVSSVPATSHRLRFGPLKQGQAYRYRVVVAPAAARPDAKEPIVGVEIERAFHTAPSSSRPLRFVIVGDVRSGHEVHRQIVTSIAAEDPDLIVTTGDLVGDGANEAEWQRFFDIEGPLMAQVAVYHAVGNHDYGRRGDGLSRFLAMFPRPPVLPGAAPTTWWSFDVSGVHFVMLDSQSYDSADQLAWLRSDLDDAVERRARAIFAFTHHGPWSGALHGDNRTAQQLYVPLLEEARAAMIVSGHDHDYERGVVGSLPYLVTGGGGAELRPMRCGVPGKKRCDVRVKRMINEHHYVVIEVLRDKLRLSPRRPDGSALEEPVLLPLRPPTPVRVAEPSGAGPGLGRGR